MVVASGRDFFAVRDVIRLLDTARRQVYIEAVILEVKVDDRLNIGSSSHGGLPDGDGNGGLIIGGVQMPDISSLSPTSLLQSSGLVGGLIGPALPGIDRIFGSSATSVTIPSYGLLFQALATNSNINVLSSPTIMALDNEESQISVGENVPYRSTSIGLPTSTGLSGLTGAIGNNIQREKLSLDMKITPHISANDMVRMEIDLQIKALGSTDGELGPTWTERSAKTKLVVRDQQSTVIGGLVADQVVYSETKVPLLGDIPILGYLFKYRSKQKAKTNLLMLLTPYVVKDQLDLQAILDRKSRERDEFLRSFEGLETKRYLPRTDYRRKRGLVEEINRTVIAVEEDAAVLRALATEPPHPDGPLDYMNEATDDDAADGDDAPAAPAAAPAPAATPEGTP
ncbi:MAG: hypothetical protein R2939_18795 [Kofleriaceae bacterium]